MTLDRDALSIARFRACGGPRRSLIEGRAGMALAGGRLV
jgi:hypothetical protein